MATIAKTWTFVAGTQAFADQMNTNYQELCDFLNAQGVPSDGSIAYTAVPSLAANDPTAVGVPVRKSYMDKRMKLGFIGAWLVGSGPPDTVAVGGYMIHYGCHTATTDASARMTVPFSTFPNGIVSVFCSKVNPTPSSTADSYIDSCTLSSFRFTCSPPNTSQKVSYLVIGW